MRKIMSVPACLGLLLMLWLQGCSPGASSLTGGSIPIGGDIEGQLFVSSRAVAPGNDVPVELINPGGHTVRETRTDHEGKFSFSQVPNGKWRLRATYGDQIGQLALDVNQEETVTVLLVLSEMTVDIQELRAVPEGPLTLSVGDTLQFTVQGIDTQGLSHTDLAVSWAVHGKIGTVTPDGVFTATRRGSGKVIAQYGEVECEVRVSVRD